VITRLRVTNYKGLREIDLALLPLTVLVGPNGAGKSSVLDALRFLRDALDADLDHAVRERGGIEALRRRSSGHPLQVGMRVDLLTSAFAASYRFALAPDDTHGYTVRSERCEVQDLHDVSAAKRFERLDGRLLDAEPELQAASPRRGLYLRSVSAQPPFDAVYRALRSIAVVNPQPAALREFQKPDAREWLAYDGGNLASIVRRLQAREPSQLARALRRLQAMVPGITAVDPFTAGPRETLRFRQLMDNDAAWSFYAPSMADGVLRATALLVALHQGGTLLLGIEEPEAALFPAAVRLLTDACVERSAERQVFITTHAPEVLEHPGVAPEGVFVMRQRRGVSYVEPLLQGLGGAAGGRSASLGELLRDGALAPIDEAAPAQPPLFEVPEGA
jgi:predicted ATPase